ncbi:MAG: SAM-dependent DNA methyltransferase [Deltaproteobacteria bacterium]|nr:SAM-dependent DNA methyltransferase [Deltaproteobacteria bacterium]
MNEESGKKQETALGEIIKGVIGSHPICHVEIFPQSTPVDHPNLAKRVAKAARKAGKVYFLTINLNDAILWKTPTKAKAPARESRLKTYATLYQITASAILDEPSKIVLRKRAREILEDLKTLQRDGRLRLIEADATFFVNRLARAAETMREPLKQSFATTISRDPRFKKALQGWAVKQGIANFGEEVFFESLSRQIVYRTLGKIIFYQSLRRHARTLPEMDFSDVDDAMIVSRLRHYFDLARAIDYQAIFEEELTEKIPFPQAAIDELKSLIADLNYYNFYTVPQDVIGQVFERLIPHEERHALGQYFTREDLVDIINAFCVRSPNAKVLDPTCGTGTFLLRAYDRKKILGERNHQRLLESLWGIDIARFPAELATINLYRQNLTDYANFPRIVAQDFFEVKPNQTFSFPPPKPVETGEPFIEEPLPVFDAAVGNFPYIRQELIEKQVKGYKKFLERVLANGWMEDYRDLFDRRGNLKLSGQADIYAYLFFQTALFLKPGGRMGIVTSNAWLDVAYGCELQKFFLKKFKIIAILESRCEPWFEDVSVNTIVTILERCDRQKECKKHIAKFVKIKKPLRELIPWDIKLDARNRWSGLDRLVTKIENVGREHIQIKGTEFKNTLRGLKTYEDADFRIRYIRQAELLSEVEKTGKTVKWGKYLRAPEVYFEILEKCKDKLVPLKDVAEVRFGIKTGVNEFFYPTEERIRQFRIEEEFLRPVLKSPKEFDGILIDPTKLTTKVFLCQKSKEELRRDGKIGALKYIEWGEKQKTKSGVPWPDVPSVKNRKPGWWALPEAKPSQIFWSKAHDIRLVQRWSPAPINADCRVYFLEGNSPETTKVLAAILNSSASLLFLEMIGRVSLGDGALDVMVEDAQDYMVIPNPYTVTDKCLRSVLSAFELIAARPIKPVFEEVKMPDRQTLDSLVLEALGLDPDKHLRRIYDGLSELVRERIDLANMRNKVKKARPKQDIEKVKQEVIQEFLPDGPKRFPEDFFAPSVKEDKMKEVPLPDEPLQLGDYFFGEQEVVTNNGFVYKAKSPVEAKYLIYSQRPGVDKVVVPDEPMPLFKTVKKYENYLRHLRGEMAKALLNRTLDQQIAERLLHQIFEENRLPEIELE